MGFGRGYAAGRGWRGFGSFRAMGTNPAFGYDYDMPKEDEIQMLKDEAGAVERELNAINKRIQDLESQS
jgi:hypothetical protein